MRWRTARLPPNRDTPIELDLMLVMAEQVQLSVIESHLSRTSSMTDFEHSDLEFHEQIRAIHEVVGHFFKKSLEEFVFGLMQDAEPESQVALWSGVTAAWIAYHEDYLNDQVLPDADEKRLISALIAIAAGVDDVSKLGVPPEVGQRLLECYDGLDEE